MIFYFVMPTLIRRIWELLYTDINKGGSDMSFPRLNNISFWLLPLSLSLLIVSSLIDVRNKEQGWTLYPPLSSLTGHSSISVDVCIIALHIARIIIIIEEV